MTLHPLAITDAERPFIARLLGSNHPIEDQVEWLLRLEDLGYSSEQARAGIMWVAARAYGVARGGNSTRSAYRKMFAELATDLEAEPTPRTALHEVGRPAPAAAPFAAASSRGDPARVSAKDGAKVSARVRRGIPGLLNSAAAA